MKIDSLVGTIKKFGESRQIWISNQTFNKLEKEKVQLNEEGNLIVRFNEIEIEISIKEKLKSNCSTAFSRVERVSEIFLNDEQLKGDIYICPRTSKRSNLIL